MKFLRFVISLLTTVGLVYVLSHGFNVGGKPIPPLGNFFNPFTGFWQNTQPALPLVPVAQSAAPTALHLDGLQQPVTVHFDDLMVPHIFAQNIEDAARMQGYITAKNRLWQMDITTRKAAGRLSEVLGERTLELDKSARRQGLPFAAENATKSWESNVENKRIMDAYTAGVNSYILALQPADYPIEFKLLNYAPEPWSNLKSALVIESMAQVLCSRESDAEATTTKELLGEATYNELFPDYNPDQTPIVPDNGQWKGIIKPIVNPAALLTTPTGATPDKATGAVPGAEPNPNTLTSSLVREEFANFLQIPSIFGDEEPLETDKRAMNGSNNWAVNGKKTASGKPMLSSDPHLKLTLPSIWYQAQLHTPDLNCYGVTLPGVPGIVIGFNEHIAWGVTNVSHDVSDWFKIKWANPEKTAYVLDGNTLQTSYRVEQIQVKDYPAPLLDTVKYTAWGPVVHEEDNSPLKDYALRWISHDAPAGDMLLSFLHLNQAKNYTEYRAAIKGFDSPAQNFVFASRTGDIAITVQGKYPIKQAGQGKFLQDGSSSANGWAGFIPNEHVPYQHNPARNFVYSANQHSAPPSYPYYFNGSFDDFRGRHIHDRLTALPNASATVDSMKSIQLDNYSTRSGEALPAMLKLLKREGLDEKQLEVAAILEKWNAQYAREEVAPSIFEDWFTRVTDMTWDEIKALDTKDKPLLYPEDWKLIKMLNKEPKHRFFDVKSTPEKESAAEIVTSAFKTTCTEVSAKLLTGELKWGKHKGFQLPHLGLIPSFGRKDLISDGHPNAPNAISATHGPSWRMVVELGDTIKAFGVYPGGQSGDPASPYYDNMVNHWLEGKYYELLFLRNATETSTRIQNTQTFTGVK